MEIILVRHGMTDYNQKKVFHGWIESNLNKTGILQGERTAFVLSKEDIDVIFTSPLKRCIDTTNIIEKKLVNVPVIIEPRLKEINFGLFEGLSYQEITRMYGDHVKKWNDEPLEYHFPGGESIPEFFERVKCFIEGLYQSNYQKVVLVTHDGCIKSILSYISNNKIDLFWKYTVKPGSISRVSLDKDFSYILSINENYYENFS